MPSPRENLMEAIKTALLDISTANGYATNPVIVTREPREAAEAAMTSTKPAIYLLEDTEDKREETSQLYQNTLRFTVTAQIAYSPGQVVSTLINAVIWDVQKALLKDRHKAGKADATRVGGVESPIDLSETIAEVTLRGEADYQSSRTAP